MKEIHRYTIDQEFMIYLIHLAFNNGDICDLRSGDESDPK